MSSLKSLRRKTLSANQVADLFDFDYKGPTYRTGTGTPDEVMQGDETVMYAPGGLVGSRDEIMEMMENAGPAGPLLAGGGRRIRRVHRSKTYGRKARRSRRVRRNRKTARRH
jgi:hypothetical protein